MESITKKPRMVFFQWDHAKLPKFLLLHTKLHVKCLSEFFDVVVISRDCDYQQVCDTYHPDITLFESGYRTSISKKISIRNTFAYPEIPKLGFHNGDPWCDCRPDFISDMEHWGIETFFSISTTMAEHTPEISDNLFVWPNFIDGEIFHDYGESKMAPILFNGSMSSLYPWRRKIHKIASNYYPSLIFPHLGYESTSPIMIHGKEYSRTINASWFVPACGSVAKEVVRKHFEVPGSKSCLLTEKSPALEAAGFLDMENCVFADENDVLYKLDYLFKNIDKLEKIINAGYDLVHSCHTLKQRDQIYQWFNLHKNLKSSEKIIQSNPFEPLKVVEKSSGLKNTPIICNGLHLLLLRQGDKKLRLGKYGEAEALFIRCLNFIPYMHEPKLKLVICNLNKGNTTEAHRWITEIITINFINNKALDSDPIEWTYLIITLLCQGKLNEAIIRSHQFPDLNHPELDRIRWVLNYLDDGAGKDSLPLPLSSKIRPSIYQLPQHSLGDWIDNLCSMLKACQQDKYVQKLNKRSSLKDYSTENSKWKNRNFKRLLKKHILSIRIRNKEKLNNIFMILKGLRIILGIKSILKYKSHFKEYFKINKDEFFEAVQNILRIEHIKTVLIIGSSGPKIADSIFAKNRIIDAKQLVININKPNDQVNSLKSRKLIDLKHYEFKPKSLESFSSELDNYINKIKHDHEIKVFDIVLINNSKLEGNLELKELQEASFIVFNDISTVSNYRAKQKLIKNPNYTIVNQNPNHHNGYVIFKKINYNHLPENFSKLRPEIKNYDKSYQ